MCRKKKIFIVIVDIGEYDAHVQQVLKAFYVRKNTEKYAREVDAMYNRYRVPSIPYNLYTEAMDYAFDKLGENANKESVEYKETVLEYVNKHTTNGNAYTMEDVDFMDKYEEEKYINHGSCWIKEVEIQ